MPRIVNEATRQVTRERILREAASEFARLGFDQANINHIADHAGIGRGTLYLYFPSKREVFIEMLQAIAERQLAAARDALTQGNTLQERLQALFQAFIRLATEDANGFHVYMSALYGVNRSFQQEALLLLREYVALIRTTLADTLPLEAWGRVDLEAAALLVLSATESLVLSARVLGYGERRLAEMAPRIATFILPGLSVPEGGLTSPPESASGPPPHD
ncbi:MAG TPA: TetR/AcrR family transcriptional regulator [Ktedonobacterales bacterium]|nr:TetR/AcrR family transcriptional regulator [Ktedonobacterales bacterium]